MSSKGGKSDCVCVVDDLFQSSRPGDLVGGCSTYRFTILTNWRDSAIKLYLFLDDIFQPSPMLSGACVADDLFQSSPLASRSSPAIVDGTMKKANVLQFSLNASWKSSQTLGNSKQAILSPQWSVFLNVPELNYVERRARAPCFR